MEAQIAAAKASHAHREWIEEKQVYFPISL